MSDFNEIRERELTLSKSKVVFQKGSFDDYCVYVINSSTKVAPLDLDYFMREYIRMPYTVNEGRDYE